MKEAPMCDHTFIFRPGSWKGRGKILLSVFEDELEFRTNWVVREKDFAGKIACSQNIQIKGLSDPMCNELVFYQFEKGKFLVDMENENVGRIVGTGVYDDKLISWEFRNNDQIFEGYETYWLQEGGDYKMSGEYVTNNQFRTVINFQISPQSTEVSTEEEDESEGEES